ncbi:MAG: endonuclease, partial [Actinobacteria bacterium]|nr:endonuclease [Actinomycetota bacterium]
MTSVTEVFTTVVMTYNLWGGFKLAARRSALRAFFTTRSPDLLTVQELRPRSRKLIDQALPGHERVHDDFPGWSEQGNIWWDRGLYRL